MDIKLEPIANPVMQVVITISLDEAKRLKVIVGQNASANRLEWARLYNIQPGNKKTTDDDWRAFSSNMFYELGRLLP